MRTYRYVRLRRKASKTRSRKASPSQTLHGITSAWIDDQHVDVKGGKIADYRVNMLITFVLDE